MISPPALPDRSGSRLYTNCVPMVLCAVALLPAPAAVQDAAAPETPPVQIRAPRPRTDEREADRQRMIASQIVSRGVTDPRVLDAMRHVPRHWFVPEPYSKLAYEDRPLPIGFQQTISQPYIVALMTELLALRPGEKVLEIGTGSGYQAAVLYELTDEVYTIEIVEPLARRTIELFVDKGYGAIQARMGDGYRGWPEAAPFDAVIVTCAPESPPQPLLDQLKIGGRMCIPVGDRGDQELVLLTKRPDGSFDRRNVIPVVFVPMTGEAEKQD